METPWNIVGYEHFTSQKGNPGIRLHCIRDIRSEVGEGSEVRSFYLNPNEIKYDPVVGHTAVIIHDKGYVRQFILIG